MKAMVFFLAASMSVCAQSLIVPTNSPPALLSNPETVARLKMEVGVLSNSVKNINKFVKDLKTPRASGLSDMNIFESEIRVGTHVYSEDRAAESEQLLSEYSHYAALTASWHGMHRRKTLFESPTLWPGSTDFGLFLHKMPVEITATNKIENPSLSKISPEAKDVSALGFYVHPRWNLYTNASKKGTQEEAYNGVALKGEFGGFFDVSSSNVVGNTDFQSQFAGFISAFHEGQEYEAHFDLGYGDFENFIENNRTVFQLGIRTSSPLSVKEKDDNPWGMGLQAQFWLADGNDSDEFRVSIYFYRSLDSMKKALGNILK